MYKNGIERSGDSAEQSLLKLGFLKRCLSRGVNLGSFLFLFIFSHKCNALDYSANFLNKVGIRMCRELKIPTKNLILNIPIFLTAKP